MPEKNQVIESELRKAEVLDVLSRNGDTDARQKWLTMEQQSYD